MATWIAHLRIAEALLEHIPALDAAQFAIGSIAPDSGIPDEKWEHFTPPPEITHFKRNRDIHKDIADLDFYRQYLAGIDPAGNPQSFSFRLGYFFHLITDNLWTIVVGKPTQERFAAQFADDKDFIWEVKKDWYGLDHLYVRTHPDCLYWQTFLGAEPALHGLDFLPSEALPRQLRHIKAYYQTDDEEIQDMIRRPKQYLTQADMDTFIVETASRLLCAYNLLRPSPPPLDGHFSVLELL